MPRDERAEEVLPLRLELCLIDHVEDDADVSSLLCRLLAAAGYSADAVFDGVTAVRRLTR